MPFNDRLIFSCAIFAAFLVSLSTAHAQQTRYADSPAFALDLREVAAPVLELTGETTFEGNAAAFDQTAVNQPYLYHNDQAVFRIVYRGGSAPKAGHPILILWKFDPLENAYHEVAGGRLPMNQVGGESAETGLIFEARIHLSPGAYRFHFEAEDTNGQAAESPGHPSLTSVRTSGFPMVIAWKYRAVPLMAGIDSRSVGKVSGTGLPTGSAFLIAPGVFLTALHNISTSGNVGVGSVIQRNFSFHYQYSDRSRFYGRGYYPTAASGEFKFNYALAEVLSLGSGNFSGGSRDWAILRILDWDDPVGLGFLEVDFDDRSHDGWVMGFPDVATMKVKNNAVGVSEWISLPNLGNFQYHYPLLGKQVSADWQPQRIEGFIGSDHWRSSNVLFRPGQSGGPVVNNGGRVWAMAVGVDLAAASGSVFDSYALRLGAIRNQLEPHLGVRRQVASGSSSAAWVHGSPNDDFSVESVAPDEALPGHVNPGRGVFVTRVWSRGHGTMGFATSEVDKPGTLADASGTERIIWFFDLDYGVSDPQSLEVFQVLAGEIHEIETAFFPATDGNRAFWAARIPGDGVFALLRSEADVSIWRDATNHGGGWKGYEWFGLFREVGGDWIYHVEHGWWYVAAESTESLLIYDAQLELWGWTADWVYPWIYWFDPMDAWTLYDRGGRPGNRWFFHAGAQEWRQEGNLMGMAPGVVYFEDFTSDPGFDSLKPGHLFWDASNGVYHINTRRYADSSALRNAYMAKSPVFARRVDPEHESFSISMRVNPRSPGYANYPAINLADSRELLIGPNVQTFTGLHLRYVIVSWADHVPRRMQLREGNTGLHFESPTVVADTWYRVEITFDAADGRISWEVRDDTTGQLFASESTSGISLLPFDQIVVGHAVSAQAYNQEAVVLIDWIEVKAEGHP